MCCTMGVVQQAFSWATYQTDGLMGRGAIAAITLTCITTLNV